MGHRSTPHFYGYFNEWLHAFPFGYKNRLAPKTKFDGHIDIGLPSTKELSNRSTRLEDRKALRNNQEIKKLTLRKEYVPDIEAIMSEWMDDVGKSHVREMAAHYGVYEHLFGPKAFFLPEVELQVKYHSENSSMPVYYGNVVKPKDCVNAPSVHFNSSSDDLWTLVLTNPDGCFYDQTKECLHWLVANIRDGDIKTGEVMCDYLPPFPPKGVGYQRLVFILYKQDSLIDLSEYKIKHENRYQLQLRTFSTYDFYKNLEDHITPAGLAFYQSDYDLSVKSTCHNLLEIKEPIYEYDFSNFYPVNEDVLWFPHKKSFNVYLDRYRDPKDIAKQKLLNKLKKVNPIGPQEEDLKYPLAQIHYVRGDPKLPSWLKREKQWEYRKLGKYSEGFLE
ncbi:large ribosomal subunit protein mL38-like isoform X2 [Artemia franciscana]|uniref:Large ribosomal subunit protein mL38 n=1 Tax=Artemia franciscana TaxID=6661 RepID=A0AA88HAP1_ARTSF|nr:hypothetical protein QYM36_014187 [Artemia franciscana]